MNSGCTRSSENRAPDVETDNVEVDANDDRCSFETAFKAPSSSKKSEEIVSVISVVWYACAGTDTECTRCTEGTKGTGGRHEPVFRHTDSTASQSGSVGEPEAWVISQEKPSAASRDGNVEHKAMNPELLCSAAQHVPCCFSKLQTTEVLLACTKLTYISCATTVLPLQQGTIGRRGGKCVFKTRLRARLDCGACAGLVRTDSAGGEIHPARPAVSVAPTGIRYFELRAALLPASKWAVCMPRIGSFVV